MFRGAPGPQATNAVAKAMLFAIGLGGFEAFEPDALLEDEESLAEYGLDATILSLPGHTPGSIGVLTIRSARPTMGTVTFATSSHHAEPKWSLPWPLSRSLNATVILDGNIRESVTFTFSVAP